MRLPDFKNDFKGYDKFDVGAVGEFDVAILLEQYQGELVAQRLYPYFGEEAGTTTRRARTQRCFGASWTVVCFALVERGEGFGVRVGVRQGTAAALQARS